MCIFAHVRVSTGRVCIIQHYDTILPSTLSFCILTANRAIAYNGDTTASVSSLIRAKVENREDMQGGNEYALFEKMQEEAEKAWTLEVFTQH